MTPVTLSREATAEVTDAMLWYDDQRPGPGSEFLDEVEAFLPHLGEQPVAFPVLHEPRGLQIRRAILPRFPYVLVFIDLGTEVRVVAVAHVRRAPGYWIRRV